MAQGAPPPSCVSFKSAEASGQGRSSGAGSAPAASLLQSLCCALAPSSARVLPVTLPRSKAPANCSSASEPQAFAVGNGQDDQDEEERQNEMQGRDVDDRLHCASSRILAASSASVSRMM
jgi:hypothetical protein